MKKTERTKQEILHAARSVFLETGLAATSMEMVAGVAGCHRRTLYRHFPLRETLIYEVVIVLMDELNVFQRSLAAGLPQSGRDAFSTFLAGLAGYMEQHRPMVRFMGEFDFFFNETSAFKPGDEVASRFMQSAHVTESLLTGIIERGIRDGSISSEVNLGLIVPTITTVLWGMAQRVAIRGSLIDEEFGVSGLEMVQLQIELYARAIDAKESGE